MKVILQADVKALGKKGNVVNVSDGYARNFLFPKKLAIEVNNTNINELNQHNAAVEAKKQKELEEAKKLAEVISSLTVVLKAKSGENGRLFGSITTKDIADELKKQHNIKLDKKKIILQDTIKTLGVTVLNVKVHEGVVAKLNVKIVEE